MYSQGSQNTDNLVYTREKSQRFFLLLHDQLDELAFPFRLLGNGFRQELIPQHTPTSTGGVGVKHAA